jgi:hypothetical protein
LYSRSIDSHSSIEVRSSAVNRFCWPDDAFASLPADAAMLFFLLLLSLSL